PPNNFFDEAVLTELADAYLALDEEKDVIAVVLCSQGKHFCAGADLRGMGAEGIRRVYRQAFRLFSGRKPVVAAVQGGAIGRGLRSAVGALDPGDAAPVAGIRGLGRSRPRGGRAGRAPGHGRLRRGHRGVDREAPTAIRGFVMANSRSQTGIIALVTDDASHS